LARLSSRLAPKSKTKTTRNDRVPASTLGQWNEDGQIAETFYYNILVDVENEKEARNLAVTKIDPHGMEYNNDFTKEGSRIALESILLLEEEEEVRRPLAEVEMSKLYALLAKFN
jgi:hypothetical protein